jgi:hypothetical protein
MYMIIIELPIYKSASFLQVFIKKFFEVQNTLPCVKINCAASQINVQIYFILIHLRKVLNASQRVNECRKLYSFILAWGPSLKEVLTERKCSLFTSENNACLWIANSVICYKENNLLWQLIILICKYLGTLWLF